METSEAPAGDLSEAIIILGKGVPAFNNKYGCLTHCIAGIAENGSWIRLYPLFAEKVLPSVQLVKNFDIIKAEYHDVKPEPTRPESRRIFPESIVKTGRIRNKKEQVKIIEKYTENGTFLHDESWNGKKTLGMVEPRESQFILSNGTPKVKFMCGSSCPGHFCELKELEKIDPFGRVIPVQETILENRLKDLSGKQLRFVMGTDGRHPQVWLIVSIHTMEVFR